MLAAVAAVERDLMQERQREAIAKAEADIGSAFPPRDGKPMLSSRSVRRGADGWESVAPASSPSRPMHGLPRNRSVLAPQREPRLTLRFVPIQVVCA